MLNLLFLWHTSHSLSYRDNPLQPPSPNRTEKQANKRKSSSLNLPETSGADEEIMHPALQGFNIITWYLILATEETAIKVHVGSGFNSNLSVTMPCLSFMRI
ncbi:hypothetical protein CEXT_592031 [Caerostris extrusa]|uniref:Uncharacterized protein n=1 Tax=Caerostris extrusa TaxID=172846 RepID=A0AAV4M449_CAEEX|nr:hypothetical protein CEXT_592031 [Caerostris extrusa]